MLRKTLPTNKCIRISEYLHIVFKSNGDIIKKLRITAYTVSELHYSFARKLFNFELDRLET